jgi:hypothetical protein
VVFCRGFLALALATRASAALGADSLTCRDWSKDFEARIAACTRLIESDQASESDLHIFFSSRGEACSAKGELDRAIADFTEDRDDGQGK